MLPPLGTRRDLAGRTTLQRSNAVNLGDLPMHRMETRFEGRGMSKIDRRQRQYLTFASLGEGAAIDSQNSFSAPTQGPSKGAAISATAFYTGAPQASRQPFTNTQHDGRASSPTLAESSRGSSSRSVAHDRRLGEFPHPPAYSPIERDSTATTSFGRASRFFSRPSPEELAATAASPYTTPRGTSWNRPSLERIVAEDHHATLRPMTSVRSPACLHINAQRFLGESGTLYTESTVGPRTDNDEDARVAMPTVPTMTPPPPYALAIHTAAHCTVPRTQRQARSTQAGTVGSSTTRPAPAAIREGRDVPMTRSLAANAANPSSSPLADSDTQHKTGVTVICTPVSDADMGPALDSQSTQSLQSTMSTLRNVPQSVRFVRIYVSFLLACVVLACIPWLATFIAHRESTDKE